MAALNLAVYDLKQAERVHGKYDKKNSIVVDLRKVMKSFAKEHNEHFEQSGSWFEINKKKNDEYIQLSEKKNPKNEKE